MQTKFLILIIFFCAVYMSLAKACQEPDFGYNPNGLRSIPHESSNRDRERILSAAPMAGRMIEIDTTTMPTSSFNAALPSFRERVSTIIEGMLRPTVPTLEEVLNSSIERMLRPPVPALEEVLNSSIERMLRPTVPTLEEAFNSIIEGMLRPTVPTLVHTISEREVIRRANAIFYNGGGSKRNISGAFNFCEEEDRRGNSQALKMLFVYVLWLFKGEKGVEKNIPEAIKYCERAAKLGNSKAKECLPVMMYNYSAYLFNTKDYEERDVPQAIDYCARAAALGNQKAVSDLSRMTAIARSRNQKIIHRLSIVKPQRSPE